MGAGMGSLKNRKKKGSVWGFMLAYTLSGKKTKTNWDCSSILNFIRRHACWILDFFFNSLKTQYHIAGIENKCVLQANG